MPKSWAAYGGTRCVWRLEIYLKSKNYVAAQTM